MNTKTFLKQVRRVKWELDQLTPLKRSVLKCRWGFSFTRPKTLQETGERYGITAERVRQIEEEALDKIKNNAD